MQKHGGMVPQSSFYIMSESAVLETLFKVCLSHFFLGLSHRIDLSSLILTPTIYIRDVGINQVAWKSMSEKCTVCTFTF